MLDAISGHVAKRIKAGHEHAICIPADIAGLLQGFARLGHISLASQEMLISCAKQVCMTV